MKTVLSCAVLILLSALCADALPIPPGGRDLAEGAKLQAWIDARNGRVEDLADGGKAIAVTAPDEAKAYLAQFAASCPAAEIRRGERILAVVKARVTDVEVGGLTAKLQFKSAPYKAVGPVAEFPIYREWREYPVLFPADDGIPQGQAQLVLFCGQKTQRVEVASVRVLQYPESTDLGSFPRIPRTYPGREPDAPWRKAALERIERERKADLAVTIRDAQGRPVPHAPVKLTLRRHAFGFGSAVPLKWLGDESENGRRLREIADRYFSLIVFENDLKDFNWDAKGGPEWKQRRNDELDRAFTWLGERRIAVRGHYLVQVARPPNLRDVQDPQAIRQHFLRATRERLDFVKSRVVEWDVINHPVAWSGADMLNKVPGLEHLDREVFDLARTLTTLPLLVNEDQLFRPGRQSDETFSYVQELKQAGYPVAGIGNQAHMHESFLPSPADILKMTDRFATLVPRQVITEFDVVTTGDEGLAADYTRDLVIACFSHPAYSGFLWWGFWAGAHWKPEAASWDKDWTPRGRAAVFTDWIGGRWRTEATVTTDAQGVARWRGFPGWYEARAGDTVLPLLEATPPPRRPAHEGIKP